MLLVDISMWGAHLRAGHTELEALLNDGAVFCHPFVIGELACWNIRNRSEVLTLLQALPMAEFVEHEDVTKFIETRHLMGKGLGYVDAAILSSSILTTVPLWTLDKRLNTIATTGDLVLAFHLLIARPTNLFNHRCSWRIVEFHVLW